MLPELSFGANRVAKILSVKNISSICRRASDKEKEFYNIGNRSLCRRPTFNIFSTSSNLASKPGAKFSRFDLDAMTDRKNGNGMLVHGHVSCCFQKYTGMSLMAKGASSTSHVPAIYLTDRH
jgi:hypothetical protein